MLFAGGTSLCKKVASYVRMLFIAGYVRRLSQVHMIVARFVIFGVLRSVVPW